MPYDSKGHPLVKAKPTAVLTTIQPPTASVRLLANHLGAVGGSMIVVGDQKGPAEYPLDHTTFLDLRQQLEGSFGLSRLLPTGHYARKNIGYLEAIRRGAECIYETDDDNAPAGNWQVPGCILSSARVVMESRLQWVNVYRYFTEQPIWPRGLPLDEINEPVPETEVFAGIRAPVQQCLVNRAPDVDAIWRLVNGQRFQFDHGMPVVLESGNWCPFNTQNTWWWPQAYPLLYLPSYCSFRMCDIWKSFVAQRCLWAMGNSVAFCAADAVQDRNVHSLMRDFADEIPGYMNNRRIAEILTDVPLVCGGDAAINLRICYQALVDNEILPAKEMSLLEAWLSDLQSLRTGGN
jgi:hypothetical protein